MASQAKQSVHTGNTIYITIGNTPIGRAQSLQAERSFGTEGVYEIGSIMPQEHVYLKYDGTLTVNRFRLRREDIEKSGFGSRGEDVLRRDIINILVMGHKDGKTGASNGEIVEAYLGCSILSYNFTITANEISSDEAQFKFLTTSATKASM